MTRELHQITKPRGKILYKLVCLSAFVVVLGGAKEVNQTSFEKDAILSSGTVTHDEKQEGPREAPNSAPIAGERQNGASEWASVLLDKAAPGNRAFFAASQFMGFYLANFTVRTEYCQALGVDISPFANAFKAEHEVLYLKSREIFSRKGVSPDGIETKMLKSLGPKMRKVVAADMAKIGDSLKISKVQVCKLFIKRGKRLAAAMLLSKKNPPLYQALVSAP